MYLGGSAGSSESDWPLYAPDETKKIQYLTYANKPQITHFKTKDLTIFIVWHDFKITLVIYLSMPNLYLLLMLAKYTNVLSFDFFFNSFSILF